MIQHDGLVWSYLTKEQRVLVDDGAFLIQDSLIHKDQEPTDYSYLVFPFAKLYEGFLKDVFLQLGIISSLDYASNRFRIGKVLNPNIVKQLHGKSAFGQLRNRYGIELAEHLWYAWKQGRNLVFHYFPGNIRMLSREQSLATIDLLSTAMEELLKQTNIVRTQQE
jgi:hypothetical protein